MSLSPHDRRTARHALWLCLLASCSLNAKPRSESGAQRASVDAGAWRPESLRTGDPRQDHGGTGGSDPDAGEPAAKASDTAAQGGKTAGSTAGSAARPAANGGRDARGGADARTTGQAQTASGATGSADPGGGGAGGVVVPDPSGAPSGGSASGSSGMRPPATGGAGGSARSVPRGVRQAFVDAVISVLMGSGQGDESTWESWRRAAGNSEELTPEFVTPMLNALVLSGTCRQRIETCISVCLVVAQNCRPCAADQQCKATLARVCGDRAASCE